MDNNNDYVLRSDVLEIAMEWCPDDDGSVGKVGDLREMLDEIESIPAADVEPVKHGHWVMYAYDEAICSECGYDRGTEFESTKEAKERWDELPMWCEGCGAKMDGEETGDDEE